MNTTKTSMADVFVDLAKYSIVTILVVSGVAVSAAIASSQKARYTASIKFKPVSAQLEIKSPRTNFCPVGAKMTGLILTSKPGEITYMIARKDGEVSGPFTTQAVRSAIGGMASFSRNLDVNQPTNAEYRILVAGNSENIESNWAPLKANCKINLDQTIAANKDSTIRVLK